MDHTIQKIIAAILLVIGWTSTVIAQDRQRSTVNVGLVYPISTTGFRAKESTNAFSLNAIGGISRVETGLSIAGVSNIILDSAAGCQLAGFSNHTRNSSSGVQIAGFMNTSGDANVQVAGFINVAKKVKGVQVAGFINIADSSDYPIGIINIIRNGEKSIGVSIDETRTTLLTFRSGGRKLYGILGLGYNERMKPVGTAQNTPETLKQATAEAGIGAHWYLTDAFRVNTEIVAITSTDFKHGAYQRNVFRLLPSLDLLNIEIFAGPTFNYVSSDKGIGANLIKNYTWSKNAGSANFQGLYFGVVGGITYRF
jgi:hypothetical protein